MAEKEQIKDTGTNSRERPYLPLPALIRLILDDKLNSSFKGFMFIIGLLTKVIDR